MHTFKRSYFHKYWRLLHQICEKVSVKFSVINQDFATSLLRLIFTDCGSYVHSTKTRQPLYPLNLMSVPYLLEEAFAPIECTAKTLNRLYGFIGYSEPLLGAHYLVL